jgi:hypothetical protein
MSKIITVRINDHDAQRYAAIAEKLRAESRVNMRDTDIQRSIFAHGMDVLDRPAEPAITPAAATFFSPVPSVSWPPVADVLAHAVAAERVRVAQESEIPPVQTPNPGSHEDETFLERWHREGKVLAGLDVAAPLYGVAEDDVNPEAD